MISVIACNLTDPQFVFELILKLFSNDRAKQKINVLESNCQSAIFRPKFGTGYICIPTVYIPVFCYFFWAFMMGADNWAAPYCAAADLFSFFREKVCPFIFFLCVSSRPLFFCADIYFFLLI